MANNAPTEEPPRNAQDIRVRQGIAEQRLQQHTGERQQRTDGECREKSRRSQLQHHGPGRLGGIAEQGGDGRANSDVSGTRDQPQAGHDRGEREEQKQ
jgi:hypothetical protein